MKKNIKKMLPKTKYNPEDLRRNKTIKRAINVNAHIAKSLV